MNVAILVSGLPPDRVGGAERQAALLARHLAERHHVTVLTRTSSVPHELAGLSQCTVVRRCAVDWRGVRFVADILSTLAMLGRRRRAIDVIVAYQTVIDGLIGVLAKILFGIPVIVSIRSEKEYRLDEGQSRVFSPFVYRHADRLAVQSPALAAALLDAFAAAPHRLHPDAIQQKLCILPNGVTAVSPEPADGDAILFIGRLVKAKGADILIDAMRHCPTESLIVIGDGPERRALEEAAAGLDNIQFTGMVDHAAVEAYLSRAKALVLPARRDDGQSNAIMEAMAHGVPVIATREGGTADLVTHGETGFVTEPGDAGALARHIASIASDPALRQRLARNALADIRRYCWPAVIEAVERELLEVTGRRRPGVEGRDPVTRSASTRR